MIIGIDGYAGAGKDTCADSLVPYGFVKVSFADKLREAAAFSFNIPYDHFIDRVLKDQIYETPITLKPDQLATFCIFLEYPDKVDEVIDKFQDTEIISNRHLLQVISTEIGRNTIKKDLWLDKYVEKISGLSHIVTPDARFSNERELIRNMKGKLFWVDNPRVQVTTQHISENDKWSKDKYDVIITNDSTIANLRYEIGIWWSVKGGKKSGV